MRISVGRLMNIYGNIRETQPIGQDSIRVCIKNYDILEKTNIGQVFMFIADTGVPL